MSKIEVDAIDKQSGSTLTLGGSGTAVTLACGATQTGFGRTGTVNWITTKKTTDFTAANGEGYFVDTGSGAVTVTLPGSPSAGNIVYVKDYDGNFATNKCTIARNGSNIRGATDNIDLNKNNAGVVCVYVDATEGWQLFFDGADTDAQVGFISATGGTVTCSGDDRIHTFTGPGTFTVNSLADDAENNLVSYLVVAGGGGGGTGGGGAGGFREVKSPTTPYTASPLDGYSTTANRITVTQAAFPIAVGGGGAGGASCSPKGTSGAVSTFSTITSAGGGGGATYQPGNAAQTGGSGGGGAYSGCNTAGAAGNTPPTTPSQGNNGGAGAASSPQRGGGGGGATQVGQAANATCGGFGGAGATTSINGTPTARAGGGGSGGFQAGNPGGSGGSGGGGAGGDGTAGAPGNLGTAGTANTGGGGGGSGYYGGAPNPGGPALAAGTGGSGIVIIRYKIK